MPEINEFTSLEKMIEFHIEEYHKDCLKGGLFLSSSTRARNILEEIKKRIDKILNT